MRGGLAARLKDWCVQRNLLTGSLLILLGFAAWGNDLLVRSLSVPSLLESPCNLFYRLECSFSVPVRALLEPFFGHLTPGKRELLRLLVHLATPLFGYALWRLYCRLGRTRPNDTPENRLGAVSRRVFLKAAGVGTLAAGGTVVYAAAIEPFRLAVREYRIPIRDLPAAFEGLRLVQISDTHYGQFVPMSYLESVVERANGLAPDLFVLTGDYSFGRREALVDGILLFKELRSRYGSVAVLGNHDHYNDANVARREFGRLGIPLLDNDRRFLAPEGLTSDRNSRDAVCVAGIGDKWTDTVSFDDALKDVPAGMPRIVLSHNPYVEVPSQHRVDLLLSGHTHGGQIRMPSLHERNRRYTGGTGQMARHAFVVSRGIGTVILPVRFRVPPELVVVTLVNSPR